jgi:hypothetical protein
MGELRKPFFLAAVALILIAVATELGATWFLSGVKAKADLRIDFRWSERQQLS